MAPGDLGSSAKRHDDRRCPSVPVGTSVAPPVGRFVAGIRHRSKPKVSIAPNETVHKNNIYIYLYILFKSSLTINSYGFLQGIGSIRDGRCQFMHGHVASMVDMHVAFLMTSGCLMS